MKKLIAMLLAVLMILPLAACGGEKKEEKVYKVAMIEGSGLEVISTPEHDEHMKKDKGQSADLKIERICYDNLSSALMDLESGKIKAIGIEECAANYIAARNDKAVVSKNIRTSDFSMMTLDTNTEVYDILNNAIKEMKADGTLDALVENELKAYIESDPVAKELPEFEDAMTIKVGVTGDVPPMDFVAANGEAAGFNIALLTEIANRAKVNIEFVQIESGARAISLSSGKVDVVFWTKSATCTECDAIGTEKVDGTLVTESYFSDSSATITLKSVK